MWRRLTNGVRAALERPAAAVYGRVAGAWLVVYLGFVIAGQRFSTAFAHGGWQIAPYDLLSARPIRTSLLVHVQPPVWNLAIGLTARWSPFPDGLSLQMLMVCIGVGIAVLVARLALLCGLSDRASFCVGLGVGLLPSTFHDVFALRYELPCALLLLAAINVVLGRDGRLDRTGLLRASAIVTMLVLTRSLYHPIWLVGVLLGFAWMARRRVPYRTIGAIVGVPMLIVVVLVAKNMALVDSPSLASWEGMNLLRSVQLAVPQDDLDRLAANGEISDVATVPPFSAYRYYRASMPPCDASGRSLLDAEYAAETMVSPFDGSEISVPNYNYRCFVDVFDQAGRDARSLIMARPGIWLHARVASLRAWFTEYPSTSSPADRWMAVGASASLPILHVDTSGWNSRFYASLVNRPLSIAPIVAFAALVVWLVGSLGRWRRRRTIDRVDLLGLLVGFVYLFTCAVSVLFELGEQARFRIGVDPIIYAALAIRTVRWWSDRRTSPVG